MPGPPPPRGLMKAPSSFAGSVSAKSTFNDLFPISLPFKFLTADAAVLSSWNSQNPYPRGFPVSRSNTSLDTFTEVQDDA